MGPSVVGGFIGAVVGIAVQLVLEIGAKIDAPWCAILIGLLTGLGARKMAGGGHSYLRGALAGLLGLLAIVGSPSIKAAVMKSQNAAKMAEKPAVTATDAATEDAKGAAGAEKGTAEEPVEEAAAGTRDGATVGKIGPPRLPQQFDTKQAIFMAVGALLAYAFGSGSGAEPRPTSDDRDAPVATDPSN